MKRGRLLLGAVLAVLGLMAWLTVRDAPGSRPSQSSPAGSPATSVRSPPLLQTLFQAAPAPSSDSDTRLAIRGTVLGAQGPIPGAVVLASAPVPGESLSELPCEGLASDLSLLDCAWGRAGEQLPALVAQRQGEVPVRAQATTAADGSFTLEDLDAGPYTLWVESAEGTGLRHDVAAGTEGVELRLGTGVRLLGTVTDETKAPVAGALVTAIFKAHSRFFETLTDEHGRFRLGALPPGEYVLIIVKEGLLTGVMSFTGYAAEVKRSFFLFHARRLVGRVLLEGGPAQGAEVRVRGFVDDIVKTATSDAEGRFSFEGLPPMRYELTATRGGNGTVVEVEFDEKLERDEVILELAPAVHVRGVVRDTEQRPIEGAWIQAIPSEDRGALALGSHTDAEGRYHLGPLPPGPLSFSIYAGGHVSPDEQEHVLPAGDSTVDFTLERERKVLVEGFVVDAEGRPIQGETLGLRTLEGDDGSFVGHATTTEDGSFALSADTPGRYLLVVGGRNGKKTRELEVLAPSSQRIVGEPFPVLEGEVVDEAGIPLPEVSLGLWPETSEGGPREQLVSDRTDSRGRFSLQAPTEGRYRVVAELGRDDFVRTASRNVELGGTPVRIQLRFEGGRGLSGVVVDRRGRPIPEAIVLVKSPFKVQMDGCGGRERGVVTGPDGRFTFRQLTGETFLLQAEKEGYSLDTTRESGGGLRVTPGEQDVRVVLVRHATLRGRVVHADGSPVKKFELNGAVLEHEQGVISLSLRRTGTVELELSAPGLATVRRSVTIHEEEDVDLGAIALGP